MEARAPRRSFSFREYLGEVVQRRDGRSTREELGAGDHLELETPSVRLSVDELYRDAGV